MNNTNDPQRNQQRLGSVMIYMAWILLIGLVTLFFGKILDWQQNPNQGLEYSATGPREVVLTRNRGGHYVAPGVINGEPVRFLLDTGATQVSIPQEVANRIGLLRGRPSLVSTANGTITVYDTRLDDVGLGNIVLHDIGAHINPHMLGDTVLLGMSFMKHLELVQRGDTLTLKQ